MNYSDLELARMHTEALYVHDANNRLLRVNEPEPEEPPPRFYMLRTTSANLWRTRYDLPADLTAELGRLAGAEPVISDLPELRNPLHYLAEYTELLTQYSPVSSTNAGPAFYLPENDPPASVVTVTPENAVLLEAHYPWTHSYLAELAPVVAHVENGEAVAVCFSARLTATCAEAGVHTMEAYRGRGYAADTTRGWAAAIRAMGRLPLYSTSWENTASQAVAAKLGAVQYGADFSLG